MIKKLLVLMIALPFGISAMTPQEWNQKCNAIDKAITSKTAQLRQVQDFFSQEILNPAKLIRMTTSLQDTILAKDAGEPSENTLASLYFLKEAAEKTNGKPGSQQLRLDEITQRYDEMYPRVFPPDNEVDIQKASFIDTLLGKLLSLKGGIALALIGYLAYRLTHREKKPKHS